MKILHITAHLGGGVGKAHSSLIGADALFVRRHYVLLEEPRDTRYAESLVKSGATLTIAPSKPTILQLAAEADIVQIEWWNHPRLYHCLCENDWPLMRSLIWCHISGLTPPLIPPSLLPLADRFMFTSPCSLALLNNTNLPSAARAKIGVVNSGFGFTARQRRKGIERRDGSVAYLGTVNFNKMSPDFFSVVDDAGDGDGPVTVWGSLEDNSDVVHAANAMRHRERVRFMGHAADPASVLQETQIFLYLLKQDHFGTAENALVEAMSCGCAPLVFPNTPELAIVTDGETGYVAEDAADAAKRLRWMRDNPAEIEAIGRNAAEHVASTRLPVYSATAFARLYGELLVREKRLVEFSAVLGTTAADWFMGTRDQATPDIPSAGEESASKGTLSHFLSCYPQDESLLQLASAGS